MKDRFNFQSFKGPYSPKLYQEIGKWLKKTVSTAAHEGQYAKETHRAAMTTEIDPKTDTTPERIQLAPGIEIIDDITSKEKTAGVDTLEGRIGPLLLAKDSQAHFIEMPAGMFVAEHPHKSESIIYTVRGQWVLCSNGRRHVMKPGTLFRFEANIPTGYEIPFDKDAMILIFKAPRTLKVEKDFIDYLKGMAARLEKEQKDGVPYTLKALPKDHPAREFARKVNPDFEKK